MGPYRWAGPPARVPRLVLPRSHAATVLCDAVVIMKLVLESRSKHSPSRLSGCNHQDRPPLRGVCSTKPQSLIARVQVCRRLSVVTSDFHMARSRRIFEVAAALTGEALWHDPARCVSCADAGWCLHRPVMLLWCILGPASGTAC